MAEDRKKTGLLLGSHHGVERDLLVHFTSQGYEMHHAEALAEAEDCINTSDYDVIFCFGNFTDGQTTFDFISSLDKSKVATVVALLDKEGLKEYRNRESSGVSHFFYVRTNFNLLQFFIDQITDTNKFRPAICPN